MNLFTDLKNLITDEVIKSMCTEQLEFLHCIKMQTSFKKAVHQFLMMVQIYEFYIKWNFRA
ncbi:hypothetical protein IW15_08580 [Chryseobacterium soli]|uniref:Uncharacterized protein n=1 Tax=Chryseobacterium soli TaxID=445961 RepID=A0A086A819_9FLAO|nr:hypothetical protein IW15_08580 [Chryseobacterium soli]